MGKLNINNRTELRALLMGLDPNTSPLWGKLKPQQMVEHLIEEVKYTNGKKIGICTRPPDVASAEKLKMIYTDAEIPKNIVLESFSNNYQYTDIETAINNLLRELDDFDTYFRQPGATAVHGGFGPMNHDEWLIWHGKHFTHHFKQFKILPEDV